MTRPASSHRPRAARRLALIALVAALLAGLVACNKPGSDGKPAPAAGAQAPGASEPVVTIDGKPITKAEYTQVLFERFGDNHLETFIEDHLIEAKAKALGVTVPDAEIEASVTKNYESLLKTRFNGNENAMRRALRERGLTLKGWKDDLTRRARRDKTIEALIAKDRGADSEAVKRRFEQRYGEDGVKYRVRHILISTKVINSRFYTKEMYEKETDQILTELMDEGKQLLTKLDKGADFAALARERSDDFTRNRGGDLGQSWKGRFGKSVDDAVNTLDVGQRSGLVKGRRGLHILEVTGVVKGVEYEGGAILVSTGPSGPADRRDQAKRDADALAKIKEVKDALAGGMAFADAARKFSDDAATKLRGGDLGTFGRRRLGKEVDKVLEAAPVGKVTEPIKTARGFWIINLTKRTNVPKDDRKTARHILLSSEFDDTKSRRLKDKLDTLAEAKAKSLLDKLKGGADFDKLARDETEDAYTRKSGGEYLNFRSTSLGPEIWKVVQTMEPKATPQLVKSRRGWHIVQVLAKDKTDFASVQAELLKEVNSQPINPTEAQKYLDKLKAAAKIDRKIGAAPPPPATTKEISNDRLKSTPNPKPDSPPAKPKP